MVIASPCGSLWYVLPIWKDAAVAKVSSALGALMKHHLRRCHQHRCFSVLLRVMSATVREPITLGGLGTAAEPRARQRR